MCLFVLDLVFCLGYFNALNVFKYVRYKMVWSFFKNDWYFNRVATGSGIPWILWTVLEFFLCLNYSWKRSLFSLVLELFWNLESVEKYFFLSPIFKILYTKKVFGYTICGTCRIVVPYIQISILHLIVVYLLIPFWPG